MVKGSNRHQRRETGYLLLEPSLPCTLNFGLRKTEEPSRVHIQPRQTTGISGIDLRGEVARSHCTQASGGELLTSALKLKLIVIKSVPQVLQSWVSFQNPLVRELRKHPSEKRSKRTLHSLFFSLMFIVGGPT